MQHQAMMKSFRVEIRYEMIYFLIYKIAYGLLSLQNISLNNVKRQIRQIMLSSNLFSIIVILYLIFSKPAMAQPHFEWVRNYPVTGRAAAIDSSGYVNFIGKKTDGTPKFNVNGFGKLNLASEVYFARILVNEGNDFMAVKKMVLIK